MNRNNQLLVGKTSRTLIPILLFVYCFLSSIAVIAQKEATLSIINKQSENNIYQFLLTDTNNKSTSNIQVGQQLRSPEGIPVFNFNGTPALKQAPSIPFEKSGLSGINAAGNNNVTLQRIEPITGKPYLIVIDRATLKILSKKID